jgi:hypothetical protein
LSNCHHSLVIPPPPSPLLVGWVHLGSAHFLMMQWPPPMILPFHDMSSPPISPTFTLFIITPHSFPLSRTLPII